MPRKRHSPEQILGKLREVEVALAKGQTVAQAVRQIAVTEQTYYRWRKSIPMRALLASIWPPNGYVRLLAWQRHSTWRIFNSDTLRSPTSMQLLAFSIGSAVTTLVN